MAPGSGQADLEAMAIRSTFLDFPDVFKEEPIEGPMPVRPRARAVSDLTDAKLPLKVQLHGGAGLYHDSCSRLGDALRNGGGLTEGVGMANSPNRAGLVPVTEDKIMDVPISSLRAQLEAHEALSKLQRSLEVAVHSASGHVPQSVMAAHAAAAAAAGAGSNPSAAAAAAAAAAGLLPGLASHHLSAPPSPYSMGPQGLYGVNPWLYNAPRAGMPDLPPPGTGFPFWPPGAAAGLGALPGPSPGGLGALGGLSETAALQARAAALAAAAEGLTTASLHQQVSRTQLKLSSHLTSAVPGAEAVGLKAHQRKNGVVPPGNLATTLPPGQPGVGGLLKEQLLAQDKAELNLVDGSSAADKEPKAEPTTVMLRNIPNRYTQSMLLKLLEERGYAGLYDFVYLPMDFRNGVNLGYAFVNLLRHEDALAFMEMFQGFSQWVVDSVKVCETSWAHPHQGLLEHVERYRNSPVMHPRMPDEYKPMVFSSGIRVPFPAPTKAIKAPKLRLTREARAHAEGADDHLAGDTLLTAVCA
eukprot:TRINITY_DN12005_c0_g1_i1.p1 TRINITY_DN12005_c0_g1~~TRINITY_DN12005_c0_g1_i1.p1  ORF type:complete len:527 (+),score=86.76 TRINITY_DN12005_c0_g1_i1:195-1775(+)